MPSSAELAVAKASLSATLFRADPTSCSRDDIDHFFSLLNSAVLQCSPANVQKCKQWTLRNFVPSNGRIAPLGKYLCALANSFTPDKDKDRLPTTRAKGQLREPSARRKRLHILYILNDIFYHVKYREGNDNFADKFETFLPALVRSAAASPNCPKHAKKIQDLISLWEENHYFSAGSIAKLRAAVEQALVPEQSGTSNGTETNGATAPMKASKEAPFIMPAMHGDPTMPWYDLPAANWLPVLEPNSTRPMKPSMIKPLQLAPGPADKALVEAVNKLLADVDKLYSTRANDGSYDIDQMGEIIEADEMEGGVTSGETYYGWSRAFCEKMKARRRKAKAGVDRGRLSSRSYSPSSDGRSRSRSRGTRLGARDRSSSRSRSSSRPGFNRRRPSPGSRSPPRRMLSQQGRSRSRSRSRSRIYRRNNSRSRSRSRSRSPRRSPGLSPDYSPPPPPKQPSNTNTHMQPVGYNNNNQFFNQPPFPPHQQQPPQPPPGALPPYPGYGGYQQPAPPFPIPPPPPPNYNGQWPPPPPPPPPPQQNFAQPGAPAPQGLPAPSWSGTWPAPPLPGMGMPQQQQQQYPPQQYPPHAQNPQQQQQYQQYQQGQQQYPQHGGQQGYGRGGAGGFQGGRGGGQWRGGWS